MINMLVLLINSASENFILFTFAGNWGHLFEPGWKRWSTAIHKSKFNQFD